MTDQPIRDAATLVIVDRSAGEPRVLMGRRRADLVFLPNVFVFPGGRVDEADALAPYAVALPDAEAALLCLARDGQQKNDATFARMLALAAVRETFEETGLAAGVMQGTGDPVPELWRPFVATGVMADLAAPRFFLRAVTPRNRPRRYDTRFFLIDAAEIAFRGAPTDDELSEVAWFGFEALRTLEVPRMTRIVIKELEPLLADGLKPADSRVIPFYFEQNDVMHRAELSLAAARS